MALGQNIGINTTGNPASTSAMLDVDAAPGNNKGLLIPRLTGAARDAIASPATGLFIYNITVNKLQYWNGSNWMQIDNTTVAATNGAGTNTGSSIAINNTGNTAHHSAILDVSSSTAGLLIPRTTTGSIVSPIAGLLIYNSATNRLNFYTTGWVQVCATSVSAATGAVTSSGISINITGATPNPCAILDISSTTSGLAIPRLTSAQRDAILSPAQGLMLFNTTTQSINVYDGTANWLNFISQTTPTAVTASAAPNPICVGSTLALTGGATDATSWNWTGPNGFTSTLQNPSIAAVTAAAAGVYILSACNNCGCTNASTAAVSVSAAPTTAAAGSDQTLPCNQQWGTLAGNAPAVGTGLWTLVSGVGTITTPSSPTSGITGLVAAGSATFRWTISNPPCAASFDDVVITTDKKPVISTCFITGCYWVACNSTHTYSFDPNCNTGGAATSYAWTINSNGSITSGQNTRVVTVNVGNGGCCGGCPGGFYNVCFTATNGCGTSSADCTTFGYSATPDSGCDGTIIDDSDNKE